MFRSIRWRLAAAFTVLILVCAAGLTLYLSHFTRDNYVDALKSQLTSQAQLVGDAGERYFAAGQVENIDALAKRLGERIGARVTIIDRDGMVLGDSDEDPHTMENHSKRPEVRQALSTGLGSSIRHSATVGCDMMYVAVPVMVNGEAVGISRTSFPLAKIDESIGNMRRTIIGGAAIAVAVTTLLAMLILRSTTEPIKKLTEMSKRVAEGELDQKIEVSSRDEVGELAGAFNQMAAKLKETVGLLTTERDMMGAILSNMADGIFVVDGESKVTVINRAAEGMFHVSSEKAVGRAFSEVVYDHEIDGILRKCLETGEQQAGLVETEPEKQSLGVIATPMSGEAGCVVLLQDLTELRHLERVRRDFIANISHELRTPATSLKILAETLQEGALDDPLAARDFLGKISVETDRLAQMVTELGELSRIESGKISLQVEPLDIGEVVKDAAKRLEAQVKRGELNLVIGIPSGLSKALADRERIEEVLVNLLHNAIKFTQPGGRIEISAKIEGDSALISVADTGIGIPPDDLPRIFERFYKADKARAGGGTGLGLAIAKHIVEMHGGKIWAESADGGGSTFSFTLPVA